jgi:hypothetical protein
MNCRCGQRCCTSLLYVACERPVPESEPAAELGALGGTRTPNLLIRSHPCGHPDPFRSVRDLGRVPARCSRESEELEGRSSAWLPARLPAAHDTGHRDALVLVANIGPSTGERTTAGLPRSLSRTRLLPNLMADGFCPG